LPTAKKLPLLNSRSTILMPQYSWLDSSLVKYSQLNFTWLSKTGTLKNYRWNKVWILILCYCGSDINKFFTLHSIQGIHLTRKVNTLCCQQLNWQAIGPAKYSTLPHQRNFLYKGKCIKGHTHTHTIF
jgi:hypothetical protein